MITIAIRELCEKLMPSGSIDMRRGAFRVIESIRLHKLLQGRGGETYAPEVSVSKEFLLDEMDIRLSGRADGIIQTENGYIVEEIKCVNVPLDTIFDGFCPTHLAQLMCYSYIYAHDHSLDSLTLRLTYCDISTEETKSFDYDYKASFLKSFTEDLLKKYISLEKEKMSRREEFCKSGRILKFPYDDYREGQRMLAEHVLQAVCTKKKLFAEAPTGTGKTMSVLFPAVKASANDYGQKIFYFTSKTTIAEAVRSAFLMLQSGGLKASGIMLSARERICPDSPECCNPAMCECAEGHYERINEACADAVRNETFFDSEVIMRYAERHSVCPYELSLAVSEWCELVICDYNYLFDPRVYLRRYFTDGGDYIFLIDEAHNLGERARGMYTHEIKSSDIEQLLMKLSPDDKLLFPVASKTLAYMKSADRLMEVKQTKSGSNGFFLSDKPFGILNRHLGELAAAIDKYYKYHPNASEFFNEIYMEIRHHLKIAELYNDKFVSTIMLRNGKYTFRELCVDPAEVISARCSLGRSTVFFSATLSPEEYYKTLLGGDSSSLYLSLDSPFPEENLCLCTTYKFSTRLDDRNATTSALVKYLYTMVSAKSGNYIAFFPSYKYMSAVYEAFIKLHPEITVMVQKSSMTAAERLEFINKFEKVGGNNVPEAVSLAKDEKKEALKALLGGSLVRGADLFSKKLEALPKSEEKKPEKIERTMLAFAVLGGAFAEGIDFAGDKLIGCAIVGVGLPGLNDESNIIAEYYNKNDYSDTMPGYDYAYRIPGMIKVLQAAGRVIRSETDRGVVLLIDDRFATPEYSRLYPNHWKKMRLVGDTSSLSELLRRFFEE